MKQTSSSTPFRRATGWGVVVAASALSLSCSPAGQDSTVGGGPKSEGGGSSTSGASTGATSNGQAGMINLGGIQPGDPMDGPCEGLECQVPSCSAGATTSLTGKVFDPAGKLPLYNVLVYVPNGPVPAFTEGISCDRCATSVTNPVTSAITDETGTFRLDKMPAGANIPLVIQVGKWRRQLVLPSVAPCVETALTDPQLTRLPRNKTEGDI